MSTRADKLRMLGNLVYEADGIVLSINKSAKDGYTPATLYIEDDIDILIIYKLTELFQKDNLFEHLTKLKITGNGRPKRMILGGYGCSTFYYSNKIVELDIDIDTSRITDASHMFSYLRLLHKIEFTRFDTSNMTSMKNMFFNCNSLKALDLSSFNTSKVEHMDSMFQHCGVDTLDLRSFDTSNVKTMDRMFDNMNNITKIDTSSFNTGNVETMVSMFRGCTELESLELNNFDMRKVTDIPNMFEGCYKLSRLEIDTWDTPELICCDFVFAYSVNIITLDIHNMDFRKVVTANSMFRGCTYLENIKFPDSDKMSFESAKSLSSMFNDCAWIRRIDLTGLVGSNVNCIENMFNRCRSLKEINMQDFSPSSKCSANHAFSNCTDLESINLSSLAGTHIISPSNGIVNTKKSLSFIFGHGRINNNIDIEYKIVNETILSSYKSIKTNRVMTKQSSITEGIPLNMLAHIASRKGKRKDDVIDITKEVEEFLYNAREAYWMADENIPYGIVSPSITLYYRVVQD